MLHQHCFSARLSGAYSEVRHTYLAVATQDASDTGTDCSPEAQLQATATHALFLDGLQQKSHKAEIPLIEDAVGPPCPGQSHSCLRMINQTCAYRGSTANFHLTGAIYPQL